MKKYNLAITAALQGDMKLVDKAVAKVAKAKTLRKPSKTTARMTTQERRYAAYKRQMRDEFVGMPWKELPLKKRAMFNAKFMWDPSKGRYGAFVRRKTPLNVSEVYKKMVEQSKRMKRMGSRIGKQGARARKRYRPLAASYDTEGL